MGEQFALMAMELSQESADQLSVMNEAALMEELPCETHSWSESFTDTELCQMFLTIVLVVSFSIVYPQLCFRVLRDKVFDKYEIRHDYKVHLMRRMVAEISRRLQIQQANRTDMQLAYKIYMQIKEIIFSFRAAAQRAEANAIDIQEMLQIMDTDRKMYRDSPHFDIDIKLKDYYDCLSS